MSPTSKRDKERLRQLKLRREEQDSLLRIIKGTKYPVKASQTKIPHNHRSNFTIIRPTYFRLVLLCARGVGGGISIRTC
jgi:hypothetical protein